MKTFDRFGKCPLCHQTFKSNACPHSYSYVCEVLNKADNSFDKDVERIRARNRQTGKK